MREQTHVHEATGLTVPGSSLPLQTQTDREPTIPKIFYGEYMTSAGVKGPGVGWQEQEAEEVRRLNYKVKPRVLVCP